MSRSSCMKYILVDSLTCPGSRLTKWAVTTKVAEKQFETTFEILSIDLFRRQTET